MSPRTQELTRELEEKRAHVKQMFEMAETPQIDPTTGQKLYDANKLDPKEVQKLESELADLEQKCQVSRLADFRAENDKKWDEMHRPEYKYQIQAGHAGYVPAPNLKADGSPFTLTDMLTQSLEFKGRRGSGGNCGAFFDKADPKGWLHPEIKSLFVSANMVPDKQRLDGAVPFAVRPLRVADVIPSETTSAQEIEYFEQTAATIKTGATTVSESAAKPEVASEYTLRSTKLEKIAAWIPATNEALDDIPQLRSLLENDLRYGVLQEEEDQILTGNGTSPNIRGFLSAAALAAGVQTQAFSTNNADTIFKAMTLVRWTGFAEPTAVIIRPENWETIRLMKTSDNEYIWGHPSVVGPETIWGKPVVVTNAISANTALLGDFSVWSQIWRRMGVQIDIANQHDDYFVKNKVAIRAEERMTLIIKRPSAFCRCTSLT